MKARPLRSNQNIAHDSSVLSTAASGRLGDLSPARRLLLNRAFFPLLAVFTFVYYAALLTNGDFILWAPAIHPGDSGQSTYGFVYNSTLLHLLTGDFTIDLDAIGFEALIREGKIYTYFGIMPALLRLPLVPFVDLTRIDVAPLYCCLAATLAALLKVFALRLACTAATARARSDMLVWALAAVLVLGGSAVPFLRATIYQEAILWEAVLASAFLVLALRGLTAPEGFSPRILMLMAIVAGCCLLTRVVMATGLYAGVLALLAWRLRGELFRGSNAANRQTQGWLRAGVRLLSTREFVAPLIALVLFASAAGLVNYKRFGNPLVFANFSIQTHLPTSHGVHLGGVPALEHYGEFNPRRIPFGLMYYFAPVWFVHSGDGDLLFNDYRQHTFDLVEAPPSSFFLTDLLLLMLAAAGLAALWRRNRLALSRPASGIIAVALALPPALLLMAFTMAFRYRMEFYPLLLFLALIGSFGIKPEIPAPRPRSVAGLVLLAAVGIIVSHLVLVVYKISPWSNLGPNDDLLQIYRTGVHEFIGRRL
jgi:hypothetical protein